MSDSLEEKERKRKRKSVKVYFERMKNKYEVARTDA